MKTKTWNTFWEGYKKPSSSEMFLINERDKILENVKRKYFGGKKVKILEVGCGYASNSRILNTKKDFQVFCIDSSKSVISKVKKDIKNALLMDAKKLKFSKNTFDIVFSSGLIEHFKNPKSLIREMTRVTKKDGLIITFVPGKYSLWRLWIKLHGKNWQHGYEEPYTQKKLDKVFNQKNVKKVEKGGIDPLSINGVLLKLTGIKTPFKKSFTNSYTEIYSVMKKT